MITDAELKILKDIAQDVFESGLCPPDHKSAKATFVVMLAGYELGLEPMQSVRGVQVVKGRTSLSADIQAALVVRSPLCRYFRCVDSDATQAVYETHRDGHPAPVRLIYTFQQAQRAGLTGSQTWRAHTEAMLRARCAAALARQVYPDLVAGVVSPDEAAEIARTDDGHVTRLPDAPAAPANEPAPAGEPAALAAYRARIAAVTTPATLVAVALELAPSVQAHREAAWAALTARAAALAAPLTAEQLGALLGEARAASADPAHWRAAGKLFAALDDATDAAAVKAAIAAHGAALAGLPEALRAVCRQAINARRAALAPAAAPTEVAAALEDALRRAEDIPALDAVAERVEAAVRQGTVTADQARALVALHDQLCTAMEREPCAASEAA